MKDARDLDEPAFPVQDLAAHQFHGMSLRDYFAAQSLLTLVGSPKAIAKEAYEIADAMLRQRAGA